MPSNKIETNLKISAEKSPKKEFKVLIVCNEDMRTEELALRDFSKPMKNIVSGFLTGKRILELSMHEKIVSIEEDIDVSSL
ncbi:MAG: hypothetical protein MI700_08025 [Balneolales bacterium]|nr:hypothetical protein [Balneolales bacterium]